MKLGPIIFPWVLTQMIILAFENWFHELKFSKSWGKSVYSSPNLGQGIYVSK